METADKKYTVIISDEGLKCWYLIPLLAQVSEQATLNLITEFNEKAKSLKGSRAKPLLSDPSLPINKYRKLLIYKRYLLIYQIKGSMVYVMPLSIAGKIIDGFYREITEIYPIALVAILK